MATNAHTNTQIGVDSIVCVSYLCTHSKNRITMNKQEVENARKVARVAVGLQTSSDLILAMGSVMAGYIMGYNALVANFSASGWPLLFGASVSGFLAYLLFDAGRKEIAPYAITVALRVFYKKSLKDRLTGAERMPWLFRGFALAVFVTMVGASLYMNYAVTPNLAEIVTDGEDKQLRQQALAEASLNEINRTYSGDRETYEAGVERARAAVENVQRLQEQATNAAGAGYRDYLRKNPGNEWAKKELSQAERAAAARYAGQLRKADRALASAEKELKAFVDKRGGQVGQAVAGITGNLSSGIARIQAAMNNWLSTLQWVMLVAAFIFVLSTALVVIFEDVVGDPATEDAQLFDTVLKAFRKPVQSGVNWLNNKVEGRGPGTMQFATPVGSTFSAPVAMAPTRSIAEQLQDTTAEIQEMRSERVSKCKDGKCPTPTPRTQPAHTAHSTQDTHTQAAHTQDTHRTQPENTEDTGGVGEVDVSDPRKLANTCRTRGARLLKDGKSPLSDPKFAAYKRQLEQVGYTVHVKEGAVSVTASKASDLGGGVYEWEVIGATEGAGDE